MSDDTLQTMVLIPQGIHIVILNFGLPIYLMWRGRNALIGIVSCWGLFILWAIIWCIVLPMIALQFSKDLFLKFPDAIGVLPTIIFGWFPSIIVCLPAYFIIKIIKLWRSKSPNMQINSDI